jgi:hypothetical protein
MLLFRRVHVFFGQCAELRYHKFLSVLLGASIALLMELVWIS